jgi:hypothetical protein
MNSSNIIADNLSEITRPLKEHLPGLAGATVLESALNVTAKIVAQYCPTRGTLSLLKRMNSNSSDRVGSVGCLKQPDRSCILRRTSSDGLYLVPASRPQHQGSSHTFRKAVIDLSVAHRISSDDKLVSKHLISLVKYALFSNGSARTMESKCNEKPIRL